MALKPLSRIVHGFMAKWLLLPALVGLVCGSAVWIGIETRKIQKEQTYYARTVALYVNSYLQHSHRQLKQFAVRFQEPGSLRGEIPFFPKYTPSIQTIHLLDPSGRIVQSWPQEAERTDFSKTIQSASLQEKLYLTPPYYSLSQDEIVVGMLVAVSGDRLMLAELNLAAMQASIQNLTQHMEGGYAFLTDAHGNLLAHPDMSKVNQQVNLGNLDIISNLPNGESKSGFYNRNGGLRLMSATSVRLSGWKVGLSQNTFSLFTPALWTIIFFLAGLLALFGVTAFLFDRHLQQMIVRPLTRFTHDLDALEQGEPPIGDSEIPLSASENCSELWSLQKNFQTMQQTVRQREASLRDREEALRQSESYYRTIFETSGAAMIIIEEDTTISHVNSNFEKLSGYSKQEVEWKKSWTEFVHPDDLDWLKEYHYLRRQDQDAAPRQYEFRFMTRQSEWRDVSYTVDMIPGTNKSIGSGIDITERKRAEEKLRDNEKKLQAITDSALDAIVMMEPQGSISYLNHAAESLFGYTSDEALGQNVHYLLAPKRYHEAHDASFPEFQRSGAGYAVGKTLELRALRKNGEEFPIELSLSSVKFHDGWHAVATIRDITERKQMEQKLKEMSIYDSLTGLYSRAFFEEEMRRLGNARYLPLGIVSCDINGLKLINDTLGHDMGDELLKTAAEILSRCFRASDIIARIGGDEFAVLLPQASEEIVNACSNRIRQEVAHYNEQGPDFGLSLAIGCAEVETTPMDVQALFKRADDDMYKDKLQKSRSSRNETVQALLKTLEERDYITEGHAGRLDDYTQQLGRSAGISEERLKDLQLLSRFHDLGKVGVPDRILFKPGPLTAEEFEEMKRHCEIGNRIALFTSDLAPIADYILKHHEHWDGRGYPLGLAGKEIPLECRILAIVDAYDTMTHERPYKCAMSHKDAIKELKRCAGTQFDPELVEQFIHIQEQNDFE